MHPSTPGAGRGQRGRGRLGSRPGLGPQPRVLPPELHLRSPLSGSSARTLHPHPQVLRPGEAQGTLGGVACLRSPEPRAQREAPGVSLGVGGSVQAQSGQRGKAQAGGGARRPSRFLREVWLPRLPLRQSQGRAASGPRAGASGGAAPSALVDHQCPGGGPCGPEDATGLPPAADCRPGGEQGD